MKLSLPIPLLLAVAVSIPASTAFTSYADSMSGGSAPVKPASYGPAGAGGKPKAPGPGAPGAPSDYLSQMSGGAATAITSPPQPAIPATAANSASPTTPDYVHVDFTPPISAFATAASTDSTHTAVLNAISNLGATMRNGQQKQVEILKEISAGVVKLAERSM